MPEQPQLPRFVPDQPFPPYAYVPGRWPHPLSDPRGHSYGVPPERQQPLDPKHWRSCRPYLYGIDLFNHGYYWEAHEVWEGLWHACGRSGQTADFLKGLIKLAAAGVKVREGVPQGVKNHARRAAELFRQTAKAAGTEDAHYLGLRLCDLIHFAQEIAVTTVPEEAAGESAQTPSFDFILYPTE
jgi:uncharacterized protein